MDNNNNFSGARKYVLDNELAQNPDIGFLELLRNLDGRFEQYRPFYEAQRQFFDSRQGVSELRTPQGRFFTAKAQSTRRSRRDTL